MAGNYSLIPNCIATTSVDCCCCNGKLLQLRSSLVRKQ